MKSQPRIAVVGAGPAGTTAARLLAARGAEVVLFEARRLPRPKLCGGGLTPKAQRLVPGAALATVERRIDRVELRAPHLAPYRLVEPEATIAMVERAAFDLALAEAAARAGADVRDGAPVIDIADEAEFVRVRTARGTLTVDAVVVADGEPSSMARFLGLASPPRRRALALEVDLPLSTLVAPDAAVLAFGLPGGYGWYFPKGDHANVGVGSYRVERYPTLRADLQDFTRTLALDPADAHVRGHWIAQGLRTAPLASRRAVLAGDAAATADALFGEGISYALISGIAAAQTIGDWADGSIADLRLYDRRLRTVLGSALGRLELIARAAELSITGALLAARLSEGVRSRAVDAIAGRRAPFAIDRHCDVACTCEMHESNPAAIAPMRTRAIRHCPRCNEMCAA